ncbi:PKD domain-containing protein [Methanofollis liminatans]|nr:PKD domain-containing protein [Methanofollis liminatans]
MIAMICCGGVQGLTVQAGPGTEDMNYSVFEADPDPGLFQANVSNEAPEPIAFGENVFGRILTAGEVDTYTFSAEAGDMVYVRMGMERTYTSARYPIVILTGPDGKEIGRATHYAAASMIVPLASTGSYTLIAGCSVPEDYGLILQRTNNPGNAIPLNGDFYHGEITVKGGKDTFTFAGAKGDVAYVRLIDLKPSHGLVITLYGPDGKEVKSVDGTNVVGMLQNLPESGDYTVMVGDGESGFTEYVVYQQCANDPAAATSLRIGINTEAKITFLGEVDTYQFPAERGSSGYIKMSSSAIGSTMILFDPDGKVVASGAEIHFTSEYTGSYTLLAFDDDGRNTGDYLVYLWLAGPEDVHASFTVNTTSGQVPLTVRFDDESTGSPASWTWDFGDGAVSTEQNPLHTYSEPGVFNVSLCVEDLNGANDTLAEEGYITVYAPPPAISFRPQNASVTLGGESFLTLVLERADEGLAGYNVTLSLSDPALASVTTIAFPEWALLGRNGTVPADSIWLAAVDLEDQIEEGALNVSLGTIGFRGVAVGESEILISVDRMTGDVGGYVRTSPVPGILNVTADLDPFPGFNETPTDPDHDGLFEDVNGNQVIDYNDVVVYYQNLEWIPEHENVVFFDYNANGEIDYDDVVCLHCEL